MAVNDLRLQLQQELEALLGSRNVYFQPPESLRLKYPCVIYSRDRGKTRHADDMPYIYTRAYELILVTKEADSPLPEKFARSLRSCEHERTYVSDNLYHDVYRIYY